MWKALALLSSVLFFLTPAMGQTVFETYRSHFLGFAPRDMIIADFNNDGILDAAFSSQLGVATALGSQDGEFDRPLKTSLAFGAMELGAADFDQDGFLDLITVNKDGFQVLFLSGLGDGRFSQVQAQAVPAGRPDLVTVGDFNEDGILDVAVVTIVLGHRIWIYTGQSNGPGNYSLSPQPVGIGLLNRPGAVASADLNNDGHLDLSTNADVLLGDGTGSFTLFPGTLGVPSNSGQSTSLLIEDFNNDGLDDIAVGYGGNGSSQPLGSLLVYHQSATQPSPTFDLVQQLDTFEGTVLSLAGGDMDSSFPRDLAVMLIGDRFKPFDRNGQGFQVLHGSPDGTFSMGKRFFTGQEPVAARILDHNSDGSNDIIIANRGIFSQTFVVVSGDGRGDFNVPQSIEIGRISTSVASGDLNTDSRLDLVVGTDAGFVPLLGNGDGTFSALSHENVGGPGPVETGDFNGDNLLDIVKFDVVNRQVYLVSSQSGGGFAVTDVAVVPVDGNVVVGDFNSDSKLDVAVSGDFVGRRSAVTLLFGDGNGHFQSQEDIPTIDGYRANRLIASDFTFDGLDDLALLHRQSYQFDFRTVLSFFKNNKDDEKDDNDKEENSNIPALEPEKVVYLHIADKELFATDAAAGDFNQDGLTDLAVYVGTELQTEIFIGNGFGDFFLQDSVFSGSDSNGMAAVDLDCNGSADLVQPNRNNDNLAVALSDSDGVLEPARFFGTEIKPRDSAIGDFDGDGDVDVAVVNEHTGSVSIFFNRLDNGPCPISPTGVKLKLTPSKINLKNFDPNKDRISAHVKFKKASSIDPVSVRLNLLSAEGIKLSGNTLIGSFNIESVLDKLSTNDSHDLRLAITFRTKDGQAFIGADSIRIKSK